MQWGEKALLKSTKSIIVVWQRNAPLAEQNCIYLSLEVHAEIQPLCHQPQEIASVT